MAEASPSPRLRAWALRSLTPLASLALLLSPAALRAQEGSATPTAPPAASSAPTAPLDPYTSSQRATNLARMHAERLNGGLGQYRAQACMHRTRGGDCLIRRDSAGFLFRFLGGPPGWQQLNLPATVETELLISRDGTRVERVLYNGPPRPSVSP